MKPKAATEHEDGLLEYLEDIIGTSRYKEPIEQALVELDALAEHRTEKLNRLRIVEREKNSLEDKKREAEEFLRLQNAYVRAQSRLYQWYLWKCLMAEENLKQSIVSELVIRLISRVCSLFFLRKPSRRSSRMRRRGIRTISNIANYSRSITKKERSLMRYVETLLANLTDLTPI